VWTPLLLRTIPIAAVVVLMIGIILTYTYAPDYYVDRYHAVRQGHLQGRRNFQGLFENIMAGTPHAVLMLGLFVLTLVPLARVAFCFLFHQGARLHVCCFHGLRSAWRLSNRAHRNTSSTSLALTDFLKFFREHDTLTSSLPPHLH
jgi:uncharacterized membrane protein